MKLNCYKKAGWFTVILVIMSTGCTSPPSVVDHEDFYTLAHKTFRKGLQEISERYIQPIPVSDIAIEGLRGLESIDNRFKVEITPSSITVKVSEKRHQTHPRPLNGNLNAWANIMVTALQYSRSHSSAIGNAKQEVVITAVLDGAVSLLDEFSRYSGAKQASENRQNRSGFGGIGVILKPVNHGALVVTVLESTPAFLAGIKANDIITHIGDTPIKGWRNKSLVRAVHGEIGSYIKIKIRRKIIGLIDYSLKRKRILFPTVTLIEENEALRVVISNFNNGTAQQIASKVTKALKWAKKPIAGMILDLRGNPGGVLNQAIKVADLFLVEGKILTTRGRHPSSQHEYLASENDILSGLPIIVLMNGSSASASEIVAAALQDQKRAIIVGTSSFGKGSVQSVSRLPNDGELTLTWSRFVTPSGYVLHNLGVPPNICSISEHDNAESIVAEVLKNASDLIRLMVAWRKVSVDNKHARMALKQNCPVNTKLKRIDILIAEKLISDTTLYSRILGKSNSLASVQD